MVTMAPVVVLFALCVFEVCGNTEISSPVVKESEKFVAIVKNEGKSPAYTENEVGSETDKSVKIKKREVSNSYGSRHGSQHNSGGHGRRRQGYGQDSYGHDSYGHDSHGHDSYGKRGNRGGYGGGHSNRYGRRQNGYGNGHRGGYNRDHNSGYGGGHSDGYGDDHGDGHNDGYGGGHDDGYGGGHNDGYGGGHNDGYGGDHDDGYGGGHNDGYGGSHGDGHNDGYGGGHNDGYGGGHNDGYGGGHDDGYGGGHNDGYGGSHGDGYGGGHNDGYGGGHDDGYGGGHNDGYGGGHSDGYGDHDDGYGGGHGDHGDGYGNSHGGYRQMLTLKQLLFIKAPKFASYLLKAAAQDEDIAEVLNKKNGPFTVFAPTDYAVAKLNESLREDLKMLDDNMSLTDSTIEILKFHIVSGSVFSKEFKNDATFISLNGTKVRLNFYQYDVTASGSNIVKKDIKAKNGIVHLVNCFLCNGNVPIDLSSADTLTTPLVENVFDMTLAKFQETNLFNHNAHDHEHDDHEHGYPSRHSYGYGSHFKGCTYFIPSNDAFTEVMDEINALTDEELEALAKCHKVEGTYYSEGLYKQQVLKTKCGHALWVGKTYNHTLQVNSALVSNKDICTTDGVVHVIDRFIIPPNFYDEFFDLPDVYGNPCGHICKKINSTKVPENDDDVD